MFASSNRGCPTPEEPFFNRKGAKSAEKDMIWGSIFSKFSFFFRLCALCAFAVQ
jgi:hypothetical protein